MILFFFLQETGSSIKVRKQFFLNKKWSIETGYNNNSSFGHLWDKDATQYIAEIIKSAVSEVVPVTYSSLCRFHALWSRSVTHLTSLVLSSTFSSVWALLLLCCLLTCLPSCLTLHDRLLEEGTEATWVWVFKFRLSLFSIMFQNVNIFMSMLLIQGGMLHHLLNLMASRIIRSRDMETVGWKT